MKKLATVLVLVLIAQILMATYPKTPLISPDGTRYTEREIANSLGRIDGDQITAHSEAVLTYANTNETALEATPLNIYAYKAYVVEVTVKYNGNPSDVNLTIGVATTSFELTGANAVTYLDSDYWTTEVIDLNTSGGTNTYYHILPEGLLNGKFLYLKYQYSGDPSNDPSITVTVTPI